MGEPIEPRLERYSIPEPNSGCYLWLAAVSSEGYGLLSVGDRLRPAHLIAYELAKGPVPEGLELDHLCRVRSCINPNHLEPITHRENVIRGLVPSVTRNRINFNAPCPRGDDHHVIWYTRGNGKRQKECRTCKAERKRNAKSPKDLAV